MCTTTTTAAAGNELYEDHAYLSMINFITKHKKSERFTNEHLSLFDGRSF